MLRARVRTRAFDIVEQVRNDRRDCGEVVPFFMLCWFAMGKCN